MGLLVSFVSPLSHENGVHARRRPNGGYANPAEPAIGRAPGTSPPCAEGDASRGAGRAGRGVLPCGQPSRESQVMPSFHLR